MQNIYEQRRSCDQVCCVCVAQQSGGQSTDGYLSNNIKMIFFVLIIHHL